MTEASPIALLWLFLAAIIAGALFALYQSPLMEIYLSDWMIC